MSNYLLRHLQVLLFSLGRLSQQPLASLMTITVIAITLVLPAGLFIASENMVRLNNRWDSLSQISLFLQQQITPEQAQQLTQQLTTWPTIHQAHYQSAEQSLAEFKILSGLGDLLDTLPSNPLPAVIMVQPNQQQQSAQTMQPLLSQLNALPQVEQAKLDMQWLQRFRSINTLIQRSTTILAILLALSVVLAIGNTIRLSILSHRPEIQVMKLVGATNGFIRRPFLYTGFWYGLLGGILAWLTLILTLALLTSAVTELAAHYNSDFSLHWFASTLFLLLPATGATLGISGAWLAVSRHLHLIEPS